MSKETFYKVNVKDELPQEENWYDTNKGNLFLYDSDNGFKWSCREDRVSEEYPEWWLKLVVVQESKKLSVLDIINQTIGNEFKDDLSPDKWMNYAIKSMHQYADQQCAEKDKEIERLADQMNVDTEKIIAFDETIRKYELLKIGFVSTIKDLEFYMNEYKILKQKADNLSEAIKDLFNGKIDDQDLRNVMIEYEKQK